MCLDSEFIYLFVRDKLQDSRTNLNQTFCGDSDYPWIEFRPKRFRLQPKEVKKSISGPILNSIAAIIVTKAWQF